MVSSARRPTLPVSRSERGQDSRPHAPQKRAARRAGPLWLAVHFPWMAGEVLNDGVKQPDVVSDETRGRWLVYRASPGARRQGVIPGMTVSAAGVICPGLSARRRQPRLEQRRLTQIGDRMLRFSPVVSVQAPDTVLIEVRGSLSLFRGLERLKRLIERELEATGHVYHFAGAPAPAAARQLARQGCGRVVEEQSALRSALGDMPVKLLDLDGKTARRLGQAGVRTLRDLWRLPAAGLARRFGPALVRELDRLRGSRPDPQPLHDSPLRFSAVLMLDWVTDDLAQIERGVEHLLHQWVAELRRSARGTSGFNIELLPERGGEALRVDIDMRRISRDMDHLQLLAGERLSRVRLNGPVAGLVLSSHRLHPLAGQNGELFDVAEETGHEAAAQWQRSEELLAMRWGQGMNALRTLSEHRPEHAWSASPTGSPRRDEPAPRAHRPLWLLDPPRPLPWPQRLSRSGNRPAFIKGPERIEAGWWDCRDQRRDYYAAIDLQGRRLWIFWDLRHKQWYLHGLFA